jgi:hypothetical protein
MFPNIPKNEQEMEDQEEYLLNPSYSRSLVSEDGTAAWSDGDEGEHPFMRGCLSCFGACLKYSDDNTSIHIVGFPMLMGWIYSLKPQMYMVLPSTLLPLPWFCGSSSSIFQG